MPLTSCHRAVRLHATNVLFIITLKTCENVVDVTGATTISFIFQKPDGSDIVRTGTISGDPTTGQVQYITVAGDLDQVGYWLGEVYVETPTYSGTSAAFEFEVITTVGSVTIEVDILSISSILQEPTVG